MVFLCFILRGGIILNKILKYVLKHKTFVIIPFIAMVIGISLDLVNPYLTKLVIDKVIYKKQYDFLSTLLLAIGGIAILRAIFGYINEFVFDYLSSLVTIDLKKDLFNHIQSLSFNYFDNMNTGELMSRIGEDVDNIWKATGFGIRLFIENMIYFITASIILFYLNWKLALISLITMPLIAFITIKLEKEMGVTYGKISDQIAVLNTTAQENIAGVRLVKAFSREKHEILKFLKFNKKNYELNMEQSRVWRKYYPIEEFLGNISILTVICFGGIFVIKDIMSIGTLVAFSGYVWMLIWPMRMMGWLTNIIAQSKASAKKIEKIMNTEPTIKNSEDLDDLSSIDGNIQFKNVSFKYNDEVILKDINLDIKSGSTIAIMGCTGSGKSSLINLIGRYYDTSSGEIYIDGHNIKNIDLKLLRENISIVPQDTFLFSDTIKQNIKYGKSNASDTEIISACTTACANNFITKLEKGYDTVIGERGVGLSGGQKQRLSIARALIKPSKVLILDDSTSALDMETEYNLLKNLYNKDKKVTTFIIAHRISAVKNADLIIYMENGSIVEQGNHQELLQKQGVYYDIYKTQFKDFESSREEVI